MNQNHKMMRLGPQGLLILRQQQSQYLQLGNELVLPQQLDYVINELVNPSLDTTPSKLLSYLAYYYPIIKNEQNIALLTYNFLKCPLFFNDSKLVSLADNYKVLELFNYVILHKFNISVPHLPFDKFFRSLVSGLQSCLTGDLNYHWKVIPVISGILSTLPLRTKYLPDTELVKLWNTLLSISLNQDKSCLRNYDLLATTLVSLSFCVDQIHVEITNHSLFLVDLIYLTKLHNGKISDVRDWQLDPVLKNLNKLALLIKYMNSKRLNLSVLDILMDKLVVFCGNLNEQASTTLDDELLKNIIFTNIVIMESVINQTMQLPNTSFQVALARKNLTMLSHMNFIIDKIGVGGFNAYNFVYYYSVDYLMTHDVKTLEILVLTLMTRIDFNRVETDSIQTSNLKYLLILIENTIMKLNPALQHDLFLTVKDIIHTPENRFFQVKGKPFITILESAHSIMLQYLDLKFLSIDETINYIGLLLHQYPLYLSLDQLIICLKKILVNNLDLYDLVFKKLFHYIIYCPPTALATNDTFKLLRSTLLYTQIIMLEFCPVIKYEENLQMCYNLIRQIDNREDFQNLRKSLFDIIIKQNRIDCQKGELGVVFWYNHVENEVSHL